MNTAEQPKKTIEVLGKQMAYVEMGEGDPIVFQHGNPTSSYLWRNIMPHLQHRGRCIALDLIGMGDSEKLQDSGPDRYTFAEHYRFFAAAMQALGVTENVTLVVHDWGSALGFHWANQHRDAIAGICYMEAIVAPFPTWDDFSQDAKGVFQGSVHRPASPWCSRKTFLLSGCYPGRCCAACPKRKWPSTGVPFAEPGEGRRPTLTWPRQIPIAGEPADVAAVAEAYAAWLKDSAVKKLFVNAEPAQF